MTEYNLQQHISTGFEVSSLPKSIRDSITINQELGIQYLWIDALCILQGVDAVARQDRDSESSKMAAVYGNAAVTMIAASSSESGEGLLRKRSIIPTSKVALDGLQYRKIWSAHRKLDSDLGLSTQYNVWAWTLQEMVLALRALFFGPSMKYWKCPRGVVVEDCKQLKLNATISTEVSCWPTAYPVEGGKKFNIFSVSNRTFRGLTYALDGSIDSEVWLMLSALAHRAVESQVI